MNLVAFLNVSGGELVIIALMALIVLGPERLPIAIRKVGQLTGQLRSLSDSFKREVAAVTDFTPEPIVKPQPRHLQAVESASTGLTTEVPATDEPAIEDPAIEDPATGEPVRVTDELSETSADGTVNAIADRNGARVEKPVSAGGPGERTLAASSGETVTLSADSSPSVVEAE